MNHIISIEIQYQFEVANHLENGSPLSICLCTSTSGSCPESRNVR